MNTTQNKTVHAADCKMAFGRKDKNCARCCELLAGAAPRAAFGHPSAHEKTTVRSWSQANSQAILVK